MDMAHVNVVLASGILERTSLRFRDDGTAVCVGALRSEERGAHGTVFKTFIAFEAYGKVGEALSERHLGDTVLLHGKLFFRKYRTKAGEEKSGLALLVQKVSCLVPRQPEVPA